MISGDRDASVEFAEILGQLAIVAERYHQRLESFYVVKDAFATALPDCLLVSRVVFDELGRLSQQGCWLAQVATSSERDDLEDAHRTYSLRVKALIQSHSCSALPAYDHHSTSVHAALVLLTVSGEKDFAREWLAEICRRLHCATSYRKYLPLSAPFEEAMLVRNGLEKISVELCSVSTLLPILLIWTAALGMNDYFGFLRAEVLPQMEEVTSNFWSPETGYDSIVADPAALHAHGIGETVSFVPESAAEFLQTMVTCLNEAEPIAQSAWYQLHAIQATCIPLLAALHWESQMPRELLVQQAMTAAGWPAAPADNEELTATEAVCGLSSH